MNEDIKQAIEANHKWCEEIGFPDIICKQEKSDEFRKLIYLGTMAAAITHELSQPIGIIRAATSAARDDIRDNLLQFEDVAPVLERIWDQSERLKAIIENFRRFARGDRSRRESVNINEVTEQAIAFFEEQFRHHNIRLLKDLCPCSPVVQANPFQLEEVLVNLLTNARDAVEGKEDAAVRVTTWCQEEKAGFRVEDNGPGISAEYRNHIFVPFFSTKPMERGTGMGLYISHKIIEEFGGHIQYKDCKSGGACFIVDLPLYKE
ncbi:ATP-binding protein [Desulfococcaceae bacterium HSG8]|nr:ATP-binding protein [Desulfococcaceae bacterium HSG8]